MNDIKNMLIQLTENKGIYNFQATVQSVDRVNSTCVVQPVDGDPVIEDVLLKTTIDLKNNGVVFFPAVGSFVTVSTINGSKNRCYISKTDEIAGIRIINRGKMEIESNGENLKELLIDMITTILKITVTTGGVVSLTPNNAVDFTNLVLRINKMFA